MPGTGNSRTSGGRRHSRSGSAAQSSGRQVVQKVPKAAKQRGSMPCKHVPSIDSTHSALECLVNTQCPPGDFGRAFFFRCTEGVWGGGAAGSRKCQQEGRGPRAAAAADNAGAAGLPAREGGRRAPLGPARLPPSRRPHHRCDVSTKPLFPGSATAGEWHGHRQHVQPLHGPPVCSTRHGESARHCRRHFLGWSTAEAAPRSSSGVASALPLEAPGAEAAEAAAAWGTAAQQLADAEARSPQTLVICTCFVQLHCVSDVVHACANMQLMLAPGPG